MNNLLILLVKATIALSNLHGAAYWGPQGGDDPIWAWQTPECTVWVQVDRQWDICRGGE